MRKFVLFFLLGVLAVCAFTYLYTHLPVAEAKTECKEECLDWKWELKCQNWWRGMCIKWDWEKVCKEWGCVKPCPTPTPEPSVEPTPEPCTQNCGVTPTFPHDEKVYTNECVGDAPKSPIFSATRISPTQVRLNWWPVEGIRKYAIIYGYTTENEMGADNIPSEATEYTINGLEANRYINVRMLAEGNNYCPAWSNIIDP